MAGLRLTLLCALLFFQVAGAAVPEDILRGALKDPRRAKLEKMATTANGSHSYNPIEKAELKVSQGELKQTDLKYGFRIYPKGPSELRAGSRYQGAIAAASLAAQNEGVSMLMVSRYHLLTRLAHLREKKKISDQLASLTKTASRALSIVANKDRAELKSYLKAKGDLDRLQIKIADVERDFANLSLEMRELNIPDIEKFDLSDWAQIPDLKRRLETLKVTKPERTLTAEVATQELGLTQREVEYDRAQESKWIDHIELSMKEDKDEKIYGVELSLNLPMITAPDLSRIDKETRAAREEVKTADTVELAEREFQNGLNELKTLLDLHSSLTETQSNLNPEQLRQASQRVSARDPMLAVELQRSWFEGRDQILELELRIRTLYIAFLHETSVIAKAPEINQLSKSLKRIM